MSFLNPKVISTNRFNWCDHCGNGNSDMVGIHIAFEIDGTQYCPPCVHAVGKINDDELEHVLDENKTVYISWLKNELKKLGVTTLDSE